MTQPLWWVASRSVIMQRLHSFLEHSAGLVRHSFGALFFSSAITSEHKVPVLSSAYSRRGYHAFVVLF